MPKIDENITIIIPARQGSKGIKEKCMAPLCDRPLIDWTFCFAKDTNYKTIVTTNFEAVASLASKYQFDVDRRPEFLCQDDTSMSEVISHVITEHALERRTILLLQPTSPFRRKLDIKKAIDKFSQNDCDLVTSVTRLPSSGIKIGTIQQTLSNVTGDNSLFFKNRQKLPDLFAPTGSFYLFEAQKFLTKQDFPHEKIQPVIIETPYNVDIDNEQDLLHAEQLADALTCD